MTNDELQTAIDSLLNYLSGNPSLTTVAMEKFKELMDIQIGRAKEQSK